ncbi:hypothetical protein TraAM80_04008 [Trypanosoma rangeli]|uniref:Uncharacterized protein n=1 Tax=Trypanosoma rangeli TaxID=5698 RepID=A0A422NM73_TRYRA|nr:uncharacterized protein TraAM80_04008 [Trypanosoma rangeli]RNF06504.1 hypothetical protein TraAM80_04008 [Trypanosoma rangeli]|eukprot:RNF06504.1 hypothetical protein TraAM80_04008 [Trypanosoma rangeli]
MHSPILLPSRIRPQSTERRTPGVTDSAAYDELVYNYATLKAKVNTALVSNADAIRHSSVVDLRRNYVGAMGLQAMTSLLAKNDQLQELRLPGSGLSNDSVVFFCRAMMKHPRLARLDFSRNGISLAAGLALLSLVRQNRNMVYINLSETQVPDAVMKKLQLALEHNNLLAARAVAVAAPPGAAADTPSGTRSIEGGFSYALRETIRKAEWDRQEEKALERLKALTHAAATATGDDSKFVPFPDGDSGWRLMEVAILAPPLLFESEVELLVRSVFPRLNEELLDRKVHLLPLFDPPDGPAGTYLKNLRFVIAVDVLRNVEKSRFLTIELVGDRAGEYEQLPANEMVKRPQLLQSLCRQGDGANPIRAESKAAPPLRPVLQTAHELATALSSWIIVAARKDTRRIGVPPSLAPLLTEEPPVEHPDYLQAQIRRTVTVGSDVVCGTQKVECGASLKAKKWQEHQLFRDKLLETAPVQELVIRNYNATFDFCGEDGQVHLKNLEEFVEAMYRRIRLIMLAHFPRCDDSHPTSYQGYNINKFGAKKLELYQKRLHDLLDVCVEHAFVKKSITDRLNLYILTPPSRNVFLLHGSEPAPVTTLIGSFASRLLLKDPQRFRIAFHTTLAAPLIEEPTDLREIICHIILQLFPDQDIYRRAIAEVDIVRLQQLLVDVLTDKVKPSETLTKGGGGDVPITVVILDGLDRVLPTVPPCKALRLSTDTGKDIWGTPEPSPQYFDIYGYIPFCLSRNVRLVLGCETNSDMHRQLESRGRDSTELLSLGPITPNDFDEMLRQDILSKVGVTLSDDDFVTIRKKEEALSPEYIMFVVDALRSFNEVPGVGTQAVMSSLPGTVKEMVQRVYGNVQNTFGTALVRTCSRLLLSSRWGIYGPQLRGMLHLPQRRFNQLLRMMRPLLEHGSLLSLGIKEGNALHPRLWIRSREFRVLLEQEALQEEGLEEDQKVWHDMLTHCYLNVVHDVVAREKSPPIFGLRSTNPYERMSVKELPYHVVQAQAWHILFHTVLSMPFLMLVYRNTLGYHLVRELIPAFNTLYEMYELGELTNHTDNAQGENSASLLRLRDYIYFLRHYNARLTEFPHLVLQTAIESAAQYTFVGSDAKEYVTRKMSYHAPLVQRRAMFFEVVACVKPMIHNGAITACLFSPKGNRVTTGSVDRSVCSLSMMNGMTTTRARQAPTRVEGLLYCETGSYHAAVCHDRTLLIYDSTQLKLVSRCDGGIFGAPLSSVAFSARGRFYLVATEDLHLRVFETEKGKLLLHVDQRQFLSENDDVKDINIRRGYACVLPHRLEDDLFYATCHNVLTKWHLKPTRDEFVREKLLEVSFTVGSGKTVLAGTHLLLHPAPFPAQADGRRAPPRFVHLYNLLQGREVAVLTSSSSQLLYQLSANEKLLASALEDGSVVIHQLPWATLQEENVNKMVISPTMEFAAYRESPVATVKALRFRGDSKALFALGNSFEMKFWVLPRRVWLDGGDVDASNASSTHLAEDNNINEEEEEELVECATDGEFVLEPADVTSWDVVQATNTQGAEVVFGDSTGRLTMLRLWNPLL